MISKKTAKPYCVRYLQADVHRLERSLAAARYQINQLQSELYNTAITVQNLRRESLRTKDHIVAWLRKAYRHSINALNRIQ